MILPNFVGSIVEQEHQALVQQLNKNVALTVESTTFTRNWFSGHAITQLTIHLQDETLGDVVINVDEALTFGPVIFADDGFHFALSHSSAKINVNEFIVEDEIEDFIKDKIKITGYC